MKLGAILASECIVGEMENEEFLILIMHAYGRHGEFAHDTALCALGWERMIAFEVF